MESFSQLKKASKLHIDGEEYRVAVLGDSATQLFAVALQGCGRLRRINLNVWDADYDQIDIQLMDSSSELVAFKPHAVVLWLSTQGLHEGFMKLTFDEKGSFADIIMERLKKYWGLASGHLGDKLRIFQPDFPEIDDRVLGNYSGKVRESFIYQLRRLNVLLQEEEERQGNVFPLSLSYIQQSMGNDRFFDLPMYYTSRMAMSLDAIPYYAKAAVDVIAATMGRIRKCVICDLDNTLWGGIIGEDGLGGIQIGELGAGRVYTELQLWLKQLKDAGILLAVCSKNDEWIAKEPFEQNEEMVLKLSDFVMFVANWEDKAANIRRIQETLDLGMDSFVFLDDNPFERGLVRSMIPEVTVPELPEDPARWLSFLQQENLFEVASFSKDSGGRTGQYRAEAQRRQIQLSCSSLEEYLQDLHMVGKSAEAVPETYARIAQLTQRSNQFNLRTVRYSEEDINRMSLDPEYLVYYYSLRDDYGDYGIVSVIILHETDGEAFIDTWLMSCRVLKRGMEQFVMNDIIRKVSERGITMLTSEYIPTAKNGMVRDIYPAMGFTAEGENRYKINVKDYILQETFIRSE